MKKVALIYDFDHTLVKNSMQNGGFVKEFNMTPSEYWDAVNSYMEKNNMDPIIAAMYYPVLRSKQLGLKYDKAFLQKHGAQIDDFFPGVEGWFERINEFGRSIGLSVEHYIISSGFTEMIENCKISKYIKKSFACEYIYDNDGNAVWPSYVVNYTQKTQYLSRIQKNCFDVLYETVEINKFVGEDDQYIPYNRMVYIGDGFTDVPCMRILKENNGYSVCVYGDETKKDNALELLNEDRVNIVAPADYSEDCVLDIFIKKVLTKMK